MGPVAKKLIAEIEKHSRMGDEPDVVQTIRRPGPIEVPKDIPSNVFAWMRTYQYLARIAAGILGSHTLRSFTKDVRVADEEYLPHGPPDSPITDSFFFGWWAIDVPVGKKESIATICADLVKKYGTKTEEVERIRAIAETHLHVVRIEARDGHTAKLRDLVTGEVLDVGLVALWDGEPGQLWLARLLPDMCFTPYALDGDDAEVEWRAYFERHLGSVSGSELASRYCEHMRGDPPNTWLEYILDGYHGGNEHTLRLSGIPDRPETLPHADDDLSLLDGLDEDLPLDNGRDLLMRDVLTTELMMDALSDFMAARESFELPEIEPDEEMLLDPMLLSYAAYGLVLEGNKTFLEEWLEDPPEDLPPDDLESLRATANGWFSLFEVAHVKLDHGMELQDLLLDKKIWVEEKMATRQIGLGDLIACWIQDYGGRHTIEGSNVLFPRMISDPVKSFLIEYHANSNVELPWRERHGQLIPVVVALFETMRERPPVPMLMNEDGDELVFSQARYLLKGDPIPKLLKAGWEGEDGSYALLQDEHLVASLEIDGEKLTLFATSPTNLESAKLLFEAAAGDLAKHQTDVFEDAQVAMRERMDAKSPYEPAQLTAEMQDELRRFIGEQLRAWLDEPIPMLGGRTPREACNTERGREDVQSMLLEQERLLEDQGQLDEPIDFRPLWEDLGLTYPSELER